MPFIGTPLDTRNTFQSLQGKRFSGDGSTTAFTLDVAPSSTLDIEVFVENVRQDPNSAYTLSGTTLTFTGAPPSGTNNIYVVHQAKAVGTIDVPATYKSEAQTISGARTFNGGITMGGTTPTLTIGDAGAEDTKIVFDGNAQDFHIGLDDSADSLTIGLGSTLGTTPYMVIDATGAVTKPLQPCVLVQPDTQRTYDASDTKIILPTERFDVNGDFNNSTYVFTAPVTGKYMFNLSLVFALMDDGYQALAVIASNRTYNPIAGFAGTTYEQFSYSVIIDMDANDTAQFNVNHEGDTSYAIRDDSAVSIHLIG